MYEPSLYQLDPENIYITDSSGNKVEHRKQTGPERQELLPDPLWKNNETYTVHVTTGVEDTNGNILNGIDTFIGDMMNEMNIKTGIDINHLIKIAKEAERILDYKLPGQVMHAGERLKKYSLEDVKTAKGN
mgnify:CR=1 FL=1